MKGRSPTADEKRHMSKVADLGCIVCRLFLGEQSPAAIHHTGGKTKQGAHFKVLPLCGPHHQTGGYGVALHAGKKEFERKYGTEQDLLQKVDELLETEIG